jgi:hypothetical protein
MAVKICDNLKRTCAVRGSQGKSGQAYVQADMQTRNATDTKNSGSVSKRNPRAEQDRARGRQGWKADL